MFQRSDLACAPRLANVSLRSRSPTRPSLSWSIREKASLNCWICCGWKSEKTPEGSRRARDFWAFPVLVGVMFGERWLG